MLQPCEIIQNLFVIFKDLCGNLCKTLVQVDLEIFGEPWFDSSAVVLFVVVIVEWFDVRIKYVVLLGVLDLHSVK